MKDKLRELAERWRRHSQNGGAIEYIQCANELRSILDAEGDGGAVAWMSPNKERLEFSRPDTVYGSHTIPLYTHPARSGVVSDATPEMCDSVRYLLVGMKQAGRTFGSVRNHCRMSGMDIENWPHWTVNRETEHFNKSACAALIWWLMHRACIQGERHER